MSQVSIFPSGRLPRLRACLTEHAIQRHTTLSVIPSAKQEQPAQLLHGQSHGFHSLDAAQGDIHARGFRVVKEQADRFVNVFILSFFASDRLKNAEGVVASRYEQLKILSRFVLLTMADRHRSAGKYVYKTTRNSLPRAV